MNQDTGIPIGGFLVAFLAGAAIGAVTVALTTPKSGPQLREDLASGLDRLRRKLARAKDAADSAELSLNA